MPIIGFGKKGKIEVIGKSVDPAIAGAAESQNIKTRSSRAGVRLEGTTKEYTGGQKRQIMDTSRRDTEQQEAEDNLQHQIMGGKPEEKIATEAMADTEKFDAENQIA